MKPRVRPRTISTASITISKLDFGRPFPLTRVDEVTNDSSHQVSSTPSKKRDVKVKTEREKVKKASKRERKGRQEDGNRKGEKEETSNCTSPISKDPNPNPSPNPPPNPSPNPALDSSYPNSDSYSSQTQSITESYIESRTSSHSSDPDTTFPAAESDDESLGEIRIDRKMIFEGIRNRKLRTGLE